MKLLVTITVVIALVESKFIYVGNEERIDPSTVQYSVSGRNGETTTTEKIQQWQNPSFDGHLEEYNQQYPQYGQKVKTTERFPSRYQNNPYLVNSVQPQIIPQQYPTVPNYVASSPPIQNNPFINPTTPRPNPSINYQYQIPTVPPQQYPVLANHHQHPTQHLINIQYNPYLNPTTPRPINHQEFSINYQHQVPAFPTVPPQQYPAVPQHVINPPSNQFFYPTTSKPYIQQQGQFLNHQEPAQQNFFPQHYQNNPYLNNVYVAPSTIPSVAQQILQTSTDLVNSEFNEGLHTSRPIIQTSRQNFGNSPQAAHINYRSVNQYQTEVVPNNQINRYYQMSKNVRPNNFDRQHISKSVPVGSHQRNSKPSQSKTNDSYSEEVADESTYEFASDVQDGINGNSHQRQETKDGANVKGQYSYNDGFVKVTVMYVADDQGYRVIGSEKEVIGEGPQHDPEGKAQISTFQNGNGLKYEITEKDVKSRKQIKT